MNIIASCCYDISYEPWESEIVQISLRASTHLVHNRLRALPDLVLRPPSSFPKSLRAPAVVELFSLMSSPIVRKKRNFKALQLDVTKSSQPNPTPPPDAPPVQVQTQPVATRAAPPANGRRRPPPMKLAAPKVSTAAAASEDGLLTVNGDKASSAPSTGLPSSRPGYHNDLTQKLANMDMSAETKYDLKNEDLRELQELGQGNGGSVKKVEHTPTGKVMAKKVCALAQPHTPFHLQNCTLWFCIYLLSFSNIFHYLDRTDRRKTCRTETNPSRTPNHARLS